jgi:hypothetical protein
MKGAEMATATTTTARTAKSVAPKAPEPTTLEYVQYALEDLDKARLRATHEVRAGIDEATERLRGALDDLRGRADDQMVEFEHTLERAGEDMRRELARRAIRAQRSPEALTELGREVRRRRAELTA